MKSAIVLDQDDVKRVLAEHYNVPATSILKSQYSYVIMFDEGKVPQNMSEQINSSGLSEKAVL